MYDVLSWLGMISGLIYVVAGIIIGDYIAEEWKKCGFKIKRNQAILLVLFPSSIISVTTYIMDLLFDSKEL